MNIQAPEFEVIREGYKLPFVRTPPCFSNRNNLSALNNNTFVSESRVAELLASGRIVEHSQTSLVAINPLSVSVQSSGKKRLILDLRYVNQFILKKKVKFEDHRKALEYFFWWGLCHKI